MYPSILNKLLLGASLIYSTQIFATETKVLQDTTSSRVGALLPLDAKTIEQLEQEANTIKLPNEQRTFIENDFVNGGGYGGNEKKGLVFYDGLPGHLPELTVSRNAKNETCYLENENVGVYQYRYWFFLRLVSYQCASKNKYHNEVYWNPEVDGTNGDYSPANNALYVGHMINAMYLDWFGIPAVKNKKGAPAQIKLVVHSFVGENIYLQKNRLIMLGDGGKNYYPFTSPGVVSFVVGLLFTEQHSHLRLSGQSGAMAYAFSSMADQAIKFYMDGQNDWEIASEISKIDQPMYYLDQPSKDCGTRAPGDNCSIDHLSQYNDKMSPHYSSGIYRRALYLLATTPDWDVKKVFSIMVQANRYYWSRKHDFSQGLCGLIKAARDYKYDESAVIDAFSQVGVRTTQNC